MPETPTLARVRELLVTFAGPETGPAVLEHFGNDQKPWASHGEPKKFGELDSLDSVEFLMMVEDDFGVEIPDEMAVHLDTLGKIAAHVDLLLASKNASAH